MAAQKAGGTVALILAGAAAGAVTHRVAQRTEHGEMLSAVLLLTAALAYPLADLRAGHSREQSQEWASVGVAGAVALVSAALPRRARRGLLAAGWLSHACFDAFHHRSASSLLPDWYPPVCAGFDAMVAARAVSGARQGAPGRPPR